MRRTRTTQVLAAATAAAAIAGLSLSSNASAVTALPGSPAPSVATSDSRVGALVRPTQAQADAVAAVVKASPGARATWDARFGTPRTLTPSLGSTLSGPRAGSAVDVARGWLSDHRAMLGLSAADVDALQLRRDHVLPDTGTHVVQLVQTFDGIAAARGGSLGLAVRKDGSVLSYTGETIRSGSLAGSYKLSSSDALQGVAAKIANAPAFAPSKTDTLAGYDVFAKGPFAASSYVKKVAFPTADGARAAYSVLFVEHLDEGYQVVVDAETGQQLYKSSLVQHESGGTIYDNYPGAPAGGQPRHVSFGANDASPSGYVDPTGLTGTRHHHVRQQRQRARQLVELPRAGRPGPAPGQPDGPVRLPRSPTTGAPRSATRPPTPRTRTPRAPTSSTSTTGSTTSTTVSGSPSPPATSS